MMKDLLRKLFKKLGYNVSRIPLGNNVYEDMARFLDNAAKETVIFDIGANVGQSVSNFLNYFPKSTIHSFEPGPETFLKLSAKHGNTENVHLQNLAMGSENKKMEFLENEYSDMSSFLDADRSNWGKVTNKVIVDATTVDHYCQQKGISKIDILKSDTQGFELEVFKGSIEMMKASNIRMVYFEFVFSDMYKGLPHFDEVYKFLTDNNFRIVKIYESHFQEGVLSWTDFLFVNANYVTKTLKN